VDSGTAHASRSTAAEKRRESSKKSARKRDAREVREAKARRAPAELEGEDEVVETTGRARIVERWTEREYNVQAGDGSRQQRRVIVIRRGETPSFGQGDDAYASWTRY
jgi:hypothetical protein